MHKLGHRPGTDSTCSHCFFLQQYRRVTPSSARLSPCGMETGLSGARKGQGSGSQALLPAKWTVRAAPVTHAPLRLRPPRVTRWSA